LKRIALVVAAAAVVAVPLTSGATVVLAGPADYRPECETAYQAGKPVFDPMIANGKPVTHAIEAALCGENVHS
jgi:hypothetical protein